MKKQTKILLALITASIGVSTVIVAVRLGVMEGLTMVLFGVAFCLVAYHVSER